MLGGIQFIGLTAKTKWELFSSRSLIAAQAGLNAVGATFIVGLLSFIFVYYVDEANALTNTFIIVMFWSVFVSPIIIMLCSAEDWVKLGELHKKMNTPIQDKTD